MEFPDNVLEIVRKAATKYPTNIEKATDLAEKNVRKLPEFGDLVNTLIHHAIQDLVHEVRHTMTRQIKNEVGSYHTDTKVSVGKSKIVNKIGLSVYLMPIAGTVLGMVLGEDLKDIAAVEQEKANGRMFNVRLCLKLAKIVPAKKRVRQVVTEKRLCAIFKSVEKVSKERGA